MRRKCSASHGWWASERGHALLWDGYFLMWLCRCVYAWESSRYTERYPNRLSGNNKGGLTKRHFCSRFVICFGQSVLCYCYILPICIGPVLLCQFPTWLTCPCVCELVREGLFYSSLFSYQFVAVLSGTSECARLSFYRFPLPQQCRA